MRVSGTGFDGLERTREFRPRDESNRTGRGLVVGATRRVAASLCIGPPRFRFGGLLRSVAVPGKDGGRSRRALHITPAVQAVKGWTSDKSASHKQYWDDVLQSVDRPSAKRLLQFVDTSVPLGLGLPLSGRGRTKARGDDGAPLPARPPSYSFFYETKLQHPVCIKLARRGSHSLVGPGFASLSRSHALMRP